MHPQDLDINRILETRERYKTATAMVNTLENSTSESTHNDEGYVEQRFEAPDFMVKWTEEQKAEFAYQLLLSIPTSRSLKVVDRLGPILHRDFFSTLPYELAVYILSHVDVLTLVHVGQISRRWKLICEDQSLWKQLYINKGWQYDKQAISNYLNQPTPPPSASSLPSSSSSSLSSPSSSKRKTKAKSKDIKKEESTSSSSSTLPTPVPLAITNDTLYDPAALPTMPGTPSTSDRLRPLRRPGDILLRFRQTRHLQHPSPTLASSSLSTPSMTPVSSSSTSLVTSSSVHPYETPTTLPPPPSQSSPLSQYQSDPLPSSSRHLDMLALQRSPPHSASLEGPVRSPSSTDAASLLAHRPTSLPNDPKSTLSTTCASASTSTNQHTLRTTTTTPSDTASSVKRGSKLLLYDTMVNHRNHRQAAATGSISQQQQQNQTTSRTPMSDIRLPVTTAPSLSTVPSPIRRSHPSPSYTRISVSSNIRPTTTTPPQVGSVSSSTLYQRRHPHTASSSRHGRPNDDQHSFSSSAVDPTQHRVIERRPFKNRPLSRQHVPYDETTLYHYQEDGDRRFINWKRLYRNRSLIDKRWRDGKYRMRTFPTASSSSPTTTTNTNTTTTTTTHHHSSGSADVHMDWIYCLQFNNRILVSGSRDRTLKIWDMGTSACLHTLYGHSASVLCLQFDDRWIISGSSDTTMIVWDVSTGEMVRTLTGHSESVLNLRFAGQRLVSSSKDRTIRVWDLATGSTTQVLRGHRAAVNAVQFKDDIVVSASGDRTIRLWNVATGASIRTFDSHSRGIACVEFDGDRIVSGSSDQTIKVWDMSTGNCLHTLAGHTELVRTLQMDRPANRIVSGSYDGSVRIWNLEKGTLTQSLSDRVDGRILNLQFDYSKVICCTNMSKIFIYDFTYGLDTQFLA